MEFQHQLHVAGVVEAEQSLDSFTSSALNHHRSSFIDFQSGATHFHPGCQRSFANQDLHLGHVDLLVVTSVNAERAGRHSCGLRHPVPLGAALHTRELVRCRRLEESSPLVSVPPRSCSSLDNLLISSVLLLISVGSSSPPLLLVILALPRQPRMALTKC